MSLPNIITLARIPLMFIIVGLMYCDRTGAATLAFLLFLAAAAGDWLDGYLARTRGLVSTFGKLMDALTDKIMVLGLVIGFVGIVRDVGGEPERGLPIILALITLCREFLVTGMRMVAAAKGIVVAADGGGKSKTVTQLIALGFLLGEPMVRNDWPRLVHGNLAGFAWQVHEAGVIIFLFGTILAVWSGWRYIARYRHLLFADAG